MTTKIFLKRLAGLLPLFFGVTLISFFVLRLAPGGPADARLDLNPHAGAEAKARFEKIYGLDRPLVEQYLSWTGRVVRLDFGVSMVDGEKVLTKIGRALPVTLLVNGFSFLLVSFLGIWMGVAGAVHKGKPLDHALTVASLAGFSLPMTWMALLAMSFLGVTLRILPVSGLASVFFDQMSFLGKVIDVAKHLILPVALSAVAGMAGMARLMRSSMIETLGQGYVRTARAKGLPENEVLGRHALRNALLPVLAALGLAVPALLSGSVIFESIFSIPGMGRLFFDAAFSRDYPVLMGLLVLGALATLIGNLLADAACAAADPRIRTQ